MNDEWIGIDECLPETNDTYLVAWLPNSCLNRKKCFMELAEFDPDEYGGGDWIFDTAFLNRFPEGVSIFAWMPLPDMYEREDVQE